MHAQLFMNLMNVADVTYYL